jgi:hypothetical protein
VKRRLIIILAIVVVGLSLLAYYLYGGSNVPNGQQPLVRLNDANILKTHSIVLPILCA